jgi:hypothetical protein
VRKVYELDTHFATGEATVQPVLLWGANGRPLRERFTKTASEASDYIQMVEPKPGTSIVLVLALGAYETYDLNRNGDGFNEFPYRSGFKPTCGCCSTDGAWVTQQEVLPNHYKSFEEHGKIYRHHQNKDPLKACGDVLKSFWNPQMHRVELLLGLRNELAPDLAERIASGEYPAVSMGCRIKYDVCTICGHKAPTRKQYCDHLKFGMRQVTPSGLRAGALNPSPKFFDISFVAKPADLTGYMMKKVAEDSAYDIRTSAELGEYLDVLEEKRAAIRKIADIDKIVRGTPVDHKSSPLSHAEAHNIQQYRDMVMPAVRGMPDLDDGTIKQLSKFPVAQVLSTLSAAGVILTTPEFVKMIVERLAPGTKVPEYALDGVVAMQGHIFDLFAQNPQLFDQLGATGMFTRSAKNVNPEIGVIAEKYLEKRSTISDYLSRQLVPPMLRAEEPPWTDMLHVRDPATGDSYETTRGAARSAHDEIAKKELARLVGTGALLAGGARIAAGALPTGLRPLAYGGAALAGHKAMRPDYGSQYLTDEGFPIPTLTELRKESSDAALPLLGSAALVTALGHDYDSRLRRGHDVHSSHAPMHRRVLDRLGEYASENPLLGVLGTMGVYGGLRKFAEYSEKLGSLISTDAVIAPDIDLDDVVEKIGSVVLR